jgi:hypothetical protein
MTSEAGIAHPQKNGFRLLVSSNPLSRFRLVVSRDSANLGKSYFGIWPFSVSHLPGFGYSWFKLIFRELKMPVSHLIGQSHPRNL